MADIWVSSDWHLNQQNILKFVGDDGNRIRPFSSVDEMNECILDHHNERVKTGDKFYNLGDVFFGDKEWFKANITKFNGSKRLIIGNHDDIVFMATGRFFKKITESRVWEDMIFSHRPLREDSLVRKKTGRVLLNVHGHIHQNDSPDGPYMNVCVEKTGYYPLNLEEIRDFLRKSISFSLESS